MISQDGISQDGITPLMGASQNGHIDVIKILVVHHADVNARDLVRLQPSDSVLGQLLIVDYKQGGWTALMYATEFSYSNIVQFLVEHQSELDAQNEVRIEDE